MHDEMEMIRCSIMRGGTSKGVFLLESDLPQEPKLRDAIILSIYGSPDLRQIDGLGLSLIHIFAWDSPGHNISLKDIFSTWY